MFGQIRKYPPIYTEVSYQTSVHLASADTSSTPPTTAVRRNNDPEVVTEVVGDSRWASVTTTGPDVNINQIRAQHAEKVASIQAAILQSEPDVEISNEEIDL